MIRLKLAISMAWLPILAAPAIAQVVMRYGSGGYGPESGYVSLYAKGKMVDFAGAVIGVQRGAPMPGMSESVTLLVKAKNGGTAMVDLGPAWYVDRQSVKFKVRDNVRVSGSKVLINGQTTILAQQITKNNRVLYLRGEDGWPMWIAYRGRVEVKATNPVSPNIVVNGTITDITSAYNDQTGWNDAVVVVDSGSQTYWLNLGPVWFANRQDMFLQVGNVIVANGAYLNNGSIGVIDLRQGFDTFQFRNPSGRPLWSPVSTGIRPGPRFGPTGTGIRMGPTGTGTRGGSPAGVGRGGGKG